MSYTYSQDTGELRRTDGTVAFVVIPEIDPELHGYLATPRWLDAINAGDGSVDEVAKRVRITSIGFDRTARGEDERDEVLALLTEFAAEVQTNAGWTVARSRWFVKFLWRFLRRAIKLLGR